jgi:DNA recombination protein RmuC
VIATHVCRFAVLRSSHATSLACSRRAHLVTATVATVFSIVSLLFGAALAWLLREREIAMLRTALAEEKARAGELVTQLSRSESNVAESRAAAAAAGERVAALQQAEERMRGEFAMLAQGALDNASRTFLELASAKLGEERQAFAGSLGTRVEEIKGVLAPVRSEFAKFSEAVGALQKSSAQELGSLKTSLAQVVQLQSNLQEAVRTTNDATGQLRNALQNPRVAGSWGEISLDRIVELAGMTDHVDFDRQTGMRSSDGTSERPDITIHLTGGLNIPVDAKATPANYVRAADGTLSDAERKQFLELSLRDIKSRITDLRTRAYDRIDGYAGMTFVYVPNESMLSSALAQDPGMIEDALHQNVVICSPLLLLCYLRAFARGWQLQQQQENAEEVARRGKMLHDRLQTFFASLGKVGWYLNHTVEKFNTAVGKMDNLLVPGRELGKLLAINTDLQPIDAIATVAREVRFAESEDAPCHPEPSEARSA